MVLLIPTPLILDLIASLPESHNLQAHPLPQTLTNPISHTSLIALSRATSKPLNSLLRGTRPYTPAPPASKPVQTPEYHALMSRLRADQERKTYAALLAKQNDLDAANSLQSLGADDPENQDPGADDISPSLVLNILLSVVMCAAAAFYLTRWWASDGVRVLFSLGTGIVVGVAEVTVYAAYLRKVDESRKRERRKKERKEMLGEFTGEAEGIDAWGTGLSRDEKAGESGVVEIETTTIWGKGVNGGVRRRVRDQYEKDQKKLYSSAIRVQ